MDDEPEVRETAGAILTKLGYDCSYSANGQEALSLYQRAQAEGKPFILVIMDITVPGGMGGKEAMQKLLKIDPLAKGIVSSGYSNDPVMADHTRYGFSGVIAKPYSISQLDGLLRRVLSAPKSTDSR